MGGERRPASLRSCVCVDKTARRAAAVAPDHFLFRLRDGFVVGYGMDHAEAHRNLPHIALLQAP